MDNSLAHIQTSTTNTFSQNLTDLHSLKSIQNIFLVLKSNSQHSDVLYPEYQKLSDLLTSLNTNSSLQKCLCDPVARTFFLNRLVQTIAKTILGSKKKYPDEIEGILYYCLQQIILLCLNSFSESQNSLLETAFIILDPHKPFYAHPIPSRSPPINDNCDKLTLFEDLISYIKSNGVKLFERLYEKVNDTNNIPSIKMMGFVCLIACKLQYFYPHSLALDHMDRIREAVRNRLFNNVSLYINSFGFMDYKVALKGFKTLLKASIASSEERHKTLDILKLQISKICLSSDNESCNDLGFRVIQDVIADLGNQRSSQLKILSKPACYQFLRSIFDENPKALFRNMRVQKSPKLFRMMFKYDLLKSHEYQSLWLNLKRENKSDSDHNRSIRKMFTKGQVHSLLERLMLENFTNIPEDVKQGDIQLISVIYNKYSRSNVLTDMLGKFYWKIMVNNDRLKDQRILERVIFDYLRLTDGSKPIAKIMNECIENIESNITNFTFFRVIQKLPIGYLFMEREYIKQKKVLQLLMGHFRAFKAQNTPTSNIDNESSYLSQISERINCLKFFLDMQVSEQPDLNYEMLEEMWIMFVEHALFPAERDLFLATLNELMKSNDGLTIRPEDLKRFFDQTILNKDVQHHYLRMSKDGALCFHNFFIAVNHNLKKIWRSRVTSRYDVKVVPEELEGFEDVWSFAMSCEDPKASSRATDILALTYDNLEDQFEPDLNTIRGRLIARCFEYMRPSSPTFSSSCCLKCLKIIKKMMYNSGMEGILELDGHTKLQKSEIFELSLDVSSFKKSEDNTKYNKKVITCSSNITVVELMKRVAKIINVDWELMRLSKYLYLPKPLKFASPHNGFTLSDVGIRKYENIKALRDRFPQRAELRRDYDTLSSRAKAVFTKLFEQFSDNGRMSPEQCTAYLCSCLNDDFPLPTDESVKKIFEDYDLDKDNYLTLDDFLKFYLDASDKRYKVVWSNLYAHKIRDNLRDISDIRRQENDKKNLVSYLIRSNNEYYKILFSLLDREEEELVSETWKVLNRLPTSPQIFEDVVRLKEVRGIEEEDHAQPNWNSILHLTSKDKALYMLNIVEYLMYYNDENTEKIALLEDPELVEYQRTWQKDFIKYEGLENLAGVFGLFKPDETTGLRRPYKRVHAFAKAMRSKLESILPNTSEEEERSKILSFMTVVSEYESCFVKSEQTVAANKMRRAILKLKQKRAKGSVSQ